jgi:hypothetical protein
MVRRRVSAVSNHEATAAAATPAHPSRRRANARLLRMRARSEVSGKGSFRIMIWRSMAQSPSLMVRRRVSAVSNHEATAAAATPAHPSRRRANARLLRMREGSQVSGKRQLPNHDLEKYGAVALPYGEEARQRRLEPCGHRRRSDASSSFETPRKRSAPQDEGIFRVPIQGRPARLAAWEDATICVSRVAAAKRCRRE